MTEPERRSPGEPHVVRPVCFMVMPFRRRPVTDAREGAPKELDCDRLWDAAFRPALADLGYLPVRADAETGSVIVKDMLNRLRHSALVVADVSLPNANVYYELGIRHAACADRCVITAADWSRQVFDVDQIRTLRYPLPDGSVPDDQAARVADVLRRSLTAHAAARSPFHELVAADVGQAFAEEAVRISRFQAELATVRLLRNGDEKRQRVRRLVAGQTEAALGLPEVALELLFLVRDTLGWPDVLDFVDALPAHVRHLDTVQEQGFLARSNLGEHEAAIAGIEELIRRTGPTPERCGLLGGRFKRMWREERARRLAARSERPTLLERRHLDRAIEAYEQGMRLDLNQYFCSGNLPALLRARGGPGDADRARAVDTLVVAACRRAEELGTGDEWLVDTLLGAAFRSGDVAEVERLAAKLDGGAAWRPQSTFADAEDWIALAPPERAADLRRILAEIAEVFPGAAPRRPADG